MDLSFTAEDEAFRHEIRSWLQANLTGEFDRIRFRGGPGDEDAFVPERFAWEKVMAGGGWIGVGLPKEHGGRGLNFIQQMIFHQEYARAGGPGRVGHIGETLVAPTLVNFGTPEQQKRFLPGILDGTELWCQGYSEPDAGSDLANIKTRAVREGDEYVITGQKVWTSLAHWAKWAFVLARTSSEGPKHKGISFLLVPVDQDGVELRPIHQMTGDSEFFETFWDGARTPVENCVGGEGNGWQVAMGLLAFERGVSTLGQQEHFLHEYDEMLRVARDNGRIDDPVIRQELMRIYTGLQQMRWTTLRTVTDHNQAELAPAGMIMKLFWASMHRRMGEVAMDVVGPAATVCTGDGGPMRLDTLQRAFLFSRADTIYGGSNQIQRNIVGERALGLPREPR